MSNFLQKLAPYLGGAGNTLVNLDPNDTGPDDLVGNLLIYSGDVIASVLTGADLPPFPDLLATPIAGKIGGEARMAFILASSGLSIAQMQLMFSHPKAAQALRYVGQVINALMAGRAMPQAPTTLITA